ncbi:metal-dependent hydrolase [Candidatus Saccharibacteria bacterium]|nr:metal-dependent hydrolase [Candidatus Saccharibacteria bacterium]
MTARTHDLAAITAYGYVVLTQPARMVTVTTALIAVVANQIGGIAPDIDQPTAPFWRNLPVGGYLGKLIDKMLGGHRFITHSLIGLVIFGVGFRALLDLLHPIMPAMDIHIVWWAFIIGMISHLVMDTFTKEGVPWLLPIPFKFGLPPVKSLRVTTGKWVEKSFFIGLLAVGLWYSSSHYTQLVNVFHHIK